MPDLAALQAKYSADITDSTFRDNHRIDVPSAVVFDVLTALKNDHGFSMLIDLTAVDWLEYEGATDRFTVVYLLLNMETGERLIVRTPTNLPSPSVTSVCSLWRGTTGWNVKSSICSGSSSRATRTFAAF